MRLIFCADPWNKRQPDAPYLREATAAELNGLPYELFNFEALVNEQDLTRALRRITPATTIELAIYRGWMLKPALYTRLYHALAQQNLLLINTPEAYVHCHYLPESYAIIKDHTPRTTWLRCGTDVALDSVQEAVQPFGEKAVIVKDFVKSRKHEWLEACYIPCAADHRAVERVVTRFVQLQGDDLHEGLVFREFVDFEPLTTHSKSGMPLTREYRLFFLDGTCLHSSEYWEEGDYHPDGPPAAQFAAVARHVQSRFFTMDVAKCLDGRWMIVELGDGQVAGLPERADPAVFYQHLADMKLQ